MNLGAFYASIFENLGWSLSLHMDTDTTEWKSMGVRHLTATTSFENFPHYNPCSAFEDKCKGTSAEVLHGSWEVISVPTY